MKTSRLATRADARIVADLVNSHELSVDPKTSLSSEKSAVAILFGFVDPFPATLYFDDDDLVGVLSMHPESLKKMLYPDLYAAPGLNLYDELIQKMLEIASDNFPGYEIRPGINSSDLRMKLAFADAGFEPLRIFWNMRGSVHSIAEPELPSGYRFQSVNLDNLEDIRSWHSVHQDAFQNHFNFKPRDFDSWHTLLLSNEALDRQGCFLLFEGEEAVGFISCTDEFADESRGYISGLGVRHSHQGRGLGEALLCRGIAYCRQRGFNSVELGADSGNESGALKLYEKVGLTVESSWVQLSRNQQV